MQPQKCTLILGVGNRYRSDDGIGSLVIDLLKAQKFNQCDLLDGGTDGLGLLDIIRQYQKVFIIDAIDAKKPPGSITVFSPQDAKNAKKIICSDALSTHGFGIAELLVLSEALAIKTEIVIIGIQPVSLEFKEGLSTVIKQQVPKICAILDAYLIGAKIQKIIRG